MALKILHEWLGGCQEIDFSKPEDYKEFCELVIQDYDVADELIQRMVEGEDQILECYQDDSTCIQMYTVIER